MTRLRIVAQQARAQLVARGTPVPSLAATDDLLRRQLAVWLPLLRFEPPTRVRPAKVLVIPVMEKD
jgi:hypothetical protein